MSISAALGYAVNHKEYKSIAFIGDGSMTGGQPYEALNHAGELQPNMLVIYNDNDYSITENTGALHSKKRLQKFSESLGFEYVGIVDGHDLGELTETLLEIREKKYPVFLHIKTIKGKGYAFAENDPVGFHSLEPFDVATGKLKKPKINPFKDLIIRKAHELEKKYNGNLYLTSPAAARSSGLKELKTIYPHNVFDTGMSEQHCVTFSAASALNGNKVICFIPAIFLPRALDQIIDVCLLNVPIVFVLLNPGIGATGPTHQGVYTFPMLNMLPNVELYNPANLEEFSSLLDKSLEKQSPVFIQKPAENISTHIGEDVVRVCDGNRLTVLSVGSMLGTALALAEKLEGVQVIHIAKVKPVDIKKIAVYVAKTQRLLILEDGCVSSGLGQHIVSNLVKEGVTPAAHEILGIKDKYPQLGTINEIYEDVGLGDDAILKAANDLLAD